MAQLLNGENGRDPMAGLPWWVRAIIIVGVPSAIALGLVWSDRTQLSNAVTDNNIRLRELKTDATAHDARVLTRFDVLERAANETNRILMANCVNNARDETARERCVGR